MARIGSSSIGVALALASVSCGSGVADQRSNAGAGGGVHAPCAACVQGGSSSASGEAGEGGDAPSGASGGAPLALGGVAIAEVSFWQALRVPLEQNGRALEPNAPIIQNKEGIWRVYLRPDLGFEARSLSAVLELATGANVQQLESKKLIRGASNDAQFSSTFNFPIDADRVLADTTYSLTLTDGPGGAVLDRFPSVGRQPLGARAISPSNSLHVVVVPITVGGVPPDVSAPTLAAFRARVRAMYPLAEVEITVHAPLVSGLSVGPEKGWDALLDAVYALRAADQPAPNVFYYGLFTPTKTFAAYCVSDCTVGYSLIADVRSEEDRGSLGLGIFSDGSNGDAPDTMAHELGHALGRDHAPCQTSDPGPFPYPGGKLGSWGFDPLRHLLLDPLIYGDVMGYCSPDWVSDFTYRALFKRLTLVNAEVSSAKSLLPSATPSAYLRVLLRSDGSLHWGSRFTPRHPPEGEVRAVTLLGVDGGEVGSVPARVRHLGDAPGGVLLLPESALDGRAGIVAIRVGNAVLALPTP